MKRTLLVVAILVAIGGAVLLVRRTSGHPEGTPLAVAEQAGSYTCPMHPSVHADHPGVCPICGMALVLRTTTARPGDTAGIAAVREVSLSPTQRVLANISTVRVERVRAATEVTAVGVIGFAEPLQASVTARFRGRIERLHVASSGQIVRHGQPLFDLYSPDLITAEREYLLALQGAPRFAPAMMGAESSPGVDLREVSRQRLITHFGLTQGQVEELERTRTPRSSIPFASPISGTVIRKDVEQGQYVEEGTVLYRLADLSTVWALLDVYEKDLAAVHVGQQATLHATAYPGRAFTGRVTFVDPVVTPDSRTVSVRLELSNRDGALKPNMYVEGTLRGAARERLMVPSGALLATGAGAVAWVETAAGVFEPRSVTTGLTEQGMTEIASGLPEGAVVAATGGFLLDSESALQSPAATPDVQGAARADSARRPSASTNAVITVDGGFKPAVVHVRAGAPITLKFVKKDASRCTAEVLFPEQKIRKALVRGDTVTITLPAHAPGTIDYSCGMEMQSGKVVVDR